MSVFNLSPQVVYLNGNLQVSCTLDFIADFGVTWEILQQKFVEAWDPVVRSQAPLNPYADLRVSRFIKCKTHKKSNTLHFDIGNTDPSWGMCSMQTLMRLKTEGKRDHLRLWMLDIYSGDEKHEQLAQALGMPVTQENRAQWSQKLLDYIVALCEEIKERSDARCRETIVEYDI
ncbi:hypothetical protein NM688_g7740 [Phlebia brevispora]|uniref:Uncharacterized protein n=1 Tax=Phlebia brevispora TaxID=194682 RepID=A0ACC1S1L7_9APHY|nr:hypothetical protein NM688_g7740 [Phlebia brevispora]